MLPESSDGWETPPTTTMFWERPNYKEPAFSSVFQATTHVHPSSMAPLFYKTPIFLPLLRGVPSLMNILPIAISWMKPPQLSMELCPWEKRRKRISLDPMFSPNWKSLKVVKSVFTRHQVQRQRLYSMNHLNGVSTPNSEPTCLLSLST